MKQKNLRVSPHQADLDMMSSQPLPLTHHAAQRGKSVGGGEWPVI